jgi:hypothetical protein
MIDRTEREFKAASRLNDPNDDLPTYFQTLQSLPVDDKKVEILTLDLKSIPKNIDDMEFKKHLFTSHHVIKMDTQKDNITGMGTGMGHVQIRVSDPET